MRSDNFILPQYATVTEIARLISMSPKQCREAIYQSLTEGKTISIIRPLSAKGKGHARYKIADVLRAWKFEHPLAA